MQEGASAHIICTSRHILKHLEKHKILSNLQHGFRSGHSCESQLITTMSDLYEAHNDKDQVDMVILDFSKAFDTVPHKKLLHKLKNYGIDGRLNAWVEQFLVNRRQRVLVDGAFSGYDKVLSGVALGHSIGTTIVLVSYQRSSPARPVADPPVRRRLSAVSQNQERRGPTHPTGGPQGT